MCVCVCVYVCVDLLKQSKAPKGAAHRRRRADPLKRRQGRPLALKRIHNISLTAQSILAPRYCKWWVSRQVRETKSRPTT